MHLRQKALDRLQRNGVERGLDERNWRPNVKNVVWEVSRLGDVHSPGATPLDPIAPTPRSTSAMMCRGLAIKNGFFVFEELDKMVDAEGEHDSGRDGVVGEMASTETERLGRHRKRTCVGE